MGTVPNSVVDEALEELQKAVADSTPLIEGLKDYQRLNLQEATKAVIDEALDHHGRRDSLLRQAVQALEQLLADGYPEVPVHEVAESVYEDLAENNRTIDVAFAHFKSPEQATSLNPTAKKAEPK